MTSHSVGKHLSSFMRLRTCMIKRGARSTMHTIHRQRTLVSAQICRQLFRKTFDKFREKHCSALIREDNQGNQEFRVSRAHRVGHRSAKSIKTSRKLEHIRLVRFGCSRFGSTGVSALRMVESRSRSARPQRGDCEWVRMSTGEKLSSPHETCYVCHLQA